MKKERQQIILTMNDDGTVTCTQDGLDLEGRGENAGRAVEHFGALVAMAHFEEPEASEKSEDLDAPADD
jgi:hypothetical protein